MLKAGTKLKKIVILKTDKNLSTHNEIDTVLDVVVTAYAQDHKEKIVIKRETTFIYPSPYSVKKYLLK